MSSDDRMDEHGSGSTGQPGDAMDSELRAARPVEESFDLEHKWAKLQKTLFNTGADPVKLGRFVILDRLGQGGMGVVYSAYDPQLDRRVALKLVRTGQSDRARVRLEREAQALARLSHPNVVPIHEVGTLDDGRVFLVMELVTGKTLRAFVDEKPRSWREVLSVYRQAGQGLAAAHAQGMMHRDFKPENAIIGEDGRVRVVDFGLARGRRTGDDADSWDEDSSEGGRSGQKTSDEERVRGPGGPVHSHAREAFASTAAVDSDSAIGGEHAGDEASEPALDQSGLSAVPGLRAARSVLGGDALAGDTLANRAQLLHASLTRTGAILGTPAYMSPEQLVGARRTGPATDQFSFCVSLYEALYGQRPFAGDDFGVLTENVQAGRLREPPRTSSVPGWLFPVLRRGLDKEPEKRYAAMDELLEVLARDPARTRRRWLLGVTAVVVIGLAGLALARARPARVAVCEGARDELIGVWDSEARRAVTGALTRTGSRYAEEATPLVIAGLGAYADAWAAMHRAACLANQRGHQSGALLDKRMVCLAKRRGALRSAVQVLGEIDATSIKNAVDVVQKLPGIGYCDSIEALEAEVPAPEDSVLAARVTTLRDQLARVEALDHAGRYGEAYELVEELAGQAEELAYKPVLAETLLAQGKVQIDKRPRDKAVAPLHRAMLTAFEVGWNRVALEALALRVFAEGMQKQVSAEVLAYVPLGEAMVQELPDGTYVHGLLLNNIGAMHLSHDELDQARTYFQRAITIKESAREPDPVELANSLFNLGLVTENDSEREALLQRAAELMTRALGPAHPTTLGVRRVYAQHMRNPYRARDAVKSACQAHETYHPDRAIDLAHCLYLLGQLDAELGDLEQSARVFSRMQAIREPGHDELSPLYLLAKGYELLDLHQYEAAAVPFQKALDEVGNGPQPWWVRETMAQAELGMGLGLQGAGAPAAATRMLEQALRSFQEIVRSSPKMQVFQLLARTRVALASALWQAPARSGSVAGSPPADVRGRALELVTQAEAWYREAGTGYERRLSEIARWRSERGIAP